MPTYRLPNFLLRCTLYELAPLGALPGVLVADDVPCATASTDGPTHIVLSFEGLGPSGLIIRLPKDRVIKDNQRASTLTPHGPVTIIELPKGSNVLYFVEGCQRVGKGYPNEHLNCYCVPTNDTPTV